MRLLCREEQEDEHNSGKRASKMQPVGEQLHLHDNIKESSAAKKKKKKTNMGVELHAHTHWLKK